MKRKNIQTNYRRAWTSRVLTAVMCIASIGAIGAQQQPALKSGFDPANLDKTCQPCQDFNQFANGGWIAKNPVPAAYPAWGRFNELAERNRDKLHEILENAARKKDAPRGSNEQKIGDYYATCMDEAKIEAEGIKPLQKELARINSIKTLDDLEKQVAHLHNEGVGVMFRFSSTTDSKNSRQVIAGAEQGGIGLPERDYYFNQDEKSKTIRAAYLKYIAQLFTLAGETDAARAASYANTIFDLETKLAGASRTRVELRNPNLNYNKMTRAELDALTPNFKWAIYLQERDISNLTSTDVSQPDFFRSVNRELTATPIEAWKTYLRFHLLNSAAPNVSSKFVDANFDFYSRTLQGTKEQLPRWKRCVQAADRALGEALGAEYVKQTFTPEAKRRAKELVDNLKLALKEDLTVLPWMSDATRTEAMKKLNTFVDKIGYPDKFRDYSALDIKRDTFVENSFRANQFATRRALNKIGKPVDRTEWGMTPPTVNAYYNPSQNEIVFPAGILQPPFYGADVDDAVNYGGIGAVIGHEMTHGFDDQGAQYDEVGNLRDWFTKEDLAKFKERAACVEKQFDAYKVADDLHLNGKLVLGESIADLGGATIAYAALQKSLQGKESKIIDGYTPEQRFFIGWAQVWASNQRPEYIRFLAANDPHPLARFRVNGPLSNMPQFAEAFSCKQGDSTLR